MARVVVAAVASMLSVRVMTIVAGVDVMGRPAGWAIGEVATSWVGVRTRCSVVRVLGQSIIERLAVVVAHPAIIPLGGMSSNQDVGRGRGGGRRRGVCFVVGLPAGPTRTAKGEISRS